MSKPRTLPPTPQQIADAPKPRRFGIYLCHACGHYVSRFSEPGKPLKKWCNSYCESTGRNVRIWLQQERP